MARNSSIDLLPPEIRDQLIARLLDTGFSDYRGLETWMNDIGHPCSKSSLQRFGSSIEDAFRSIDIRTRVVEAASRYSTADTILDNAAALLRWVIR